VSGHAIPYRRLLDERSWSRFLKVDVLRALSYVKRVLRLVEVLRGGSTSLQTVKIAAGIIGRDTVGHSRDVREALERLLGITCVGCDELVRDVARGIPLERVATGVKLVFHDTPLLRELKLLEGILAEVIRRSTRVDEGYVEEVVCRDYVSLAGNPLELFRLFRGLVAALLRLLPLYSPVTFTVRSLRLAPRFAAAKLLGDPLPELLNRLGVDLVEFLPVEPGDYTLLTHRAGSFGDLISSAVDRAYAALREVGNARPKYLKVLDWGRAYVEFALAQLSSFAELLGVTQEVERVENLVREVGRAVRTTDRYTFLTARVTVGPGPKAYIGSRRASTELLFKGLAPYLVLNLAEVELLARRDSGPTSLNLSLYIKRAR